MRIAAFHFELQVRFPRLHEMKFLKREREAFRQRHGLAKFEKGRGALKAKITVRINEVIKELGLHGELVFQV